MVNLEADRFVHLLGKYLRFFAVPQSAFIVGCHTHGTWPGKRGACVRWGRGWARCRSLKAPNSQKQIEPQHVAASVVCQSASLSVCQFCQSSAAAPQFFWLFLWPRVERVLNLRRFIARLPFHYFSPFRRRCVAVYFCKFLSYFWFLLLYFCIFFPFSTLSLSPFACAFRSCHVVCM